MECPKPCARSGIPSHVAAIQAHRRQRRAERLRLWYGAADNDQSPFVLTLTPQYVAYALRKALPVTLEEIEEYAQQNEDRLRAIAHDARACGQNAKALG
jgi:hypothetical protein